MVEKKMTGRRLQPINGELPPLSEFQPGDYCGPVTSYTAGVPIVFYRLPTNYMSFGHCASPPHTFRECPDGSLEIRNSILHTSRFGQWHGYLDEGHVWRQV
jgi:hypothetical protein